MEYMQDLFSKLGNSAGPKTTLIMKGYVQDILLKRGDVVEAVVKKGGYIYVCGGTNMVNGVTEQLERTLQEYNCVSLEEMVHARRYQKEMFG